MEIGSDGSYPVNDLSISLAVNFVTNPMGIDALVTSSESNLVESVVQTLEYVATLLNRQTVNAAIILLSSADDYWEQHNHYYLVQQIKNKNSELFFREDNQFPVSIFSVALSVDPSSYGFFNDLSKSFNGNVLEIENDSNVELLLDGYFHEPLMDPAVQLDLVQFTYTGARVQGNGHKNLFTLNLGTEWCVVGQITSSREFSIKKDVLQLDKSKFQQTEFQSSLRMNANIMSSFMKTLWAQKSIQSLPDQEAHQLIKQVSIVNSYCCILLKLNGFFFL